MTKICAIGECMIEISARDASSWNSSYAGDTFNTIWTMRGLLPKEIELDYITAFGDDPFSDGQKELFVANDLGFAESPTIEGARPGLYAITLDGFERSFTYWRSDAAARALADNAENLGLSLRGSELVYFSGITLAILSPRSRRTLFQELARARAAGTRIAFDPNYRRRLWNTSKEARRAIDEALSMTDIALPTFQDEQDLYGDRDPPDTIGRMRAAGVNEVVVKCGSRPAWYTGAGSHGTVAAVEIENLVDTSGAGDAFNGGYLAARICGQLLERACSIAHSVAGIAVRTKGALVAINALEKIGCIEQR